MCTCIYICIYIYIHTCTYMITQGGCAVPPLRGHGDRYPSGGAGGRRAAH